MDSKELIELILGVIALAFSCWGVVRYLVDRMDTKFEVERKERLASETKLAEIIDKMKESHVRRDDFLELKSGITSLGTSVNARMDNMVNLMTQIVMKGNDQK